ncbi:hypothetical protein [Streptomyces tailanensis]|uniref:hypothetical protein n=1 Tax=Streptomyces tailanensis TaxID=2569858 RepID=UPI00122E5AC0|nr:hypothetical protein [Streptomyces tailanensis]
MTSQRAIRTRADGADPLPRTAAHTKPGPGNLRLPVSIAAAAAMALAGLLPTAAPAQAAADRAPLAVALPAQPYPPPGCAATVNRTVVSGGDDLTVSGNCFMPFSVVTIRLDNTILETAVADSSGVVTETVTIPEDTPIGRHTISLSGTGSTGSPMTLSVEIRVTF